MRTKYFSDLANMEKDTISFASKDVNVLRSEMAPFVHECLVKGMRLLEEKRVQYEGANIKENVDREDVGLGMFFIGTKSGPASKLM